MQAAQQTFISSTFWTERVGPTAALKTLEVMEREKSWQVITKIGHNISCQWQSLADKYQLDISTWGLPALSGFTFNLTNALSYKTLITQEMLKKGYLSANSVYACTEHNQEIVDGYFAELKNAELLRDRIDLAGAITPYIGKFYLHKLYGDVNLEVMGKLQDWKP